MPTLQHRRKALAVLIGLVFCLGRISMKLEKMWDSKQVAVGIMMGVLITWLLLREPGRFSLKNHLPGTILFIAAVNGLSALFLPSGEFIHLLIVCTIVVILLYAHAWTYQKELETRKDTGAITDP